MSGGEVDTCHLLILSYFDFDFVEIGKRTVKQRGHEVLDGRGHK